MSKKIFNRFIKIKKKKKGRHKENMDIGREILMGNFPPVLIELQTTYQVSFTHSVQINSLCVNLKFGLLLGAAGVDLV
jgi:accessory gene regulator protein AgrB